MTTRFTSRASFRHLAWQILLYQVGVTLAILIIGILSGWTGTNQFASGMFIAGVIALLLGGAGLLGTNFFDLSGLYGSANRDGEHDLVTRQQNNPERSGFVNIMRVSLGVGILSILLGFLLNTVRP